MAPSALLAGLALAAALAGCSGGVNLTVGDGGGAPSKVPGNADPADLRVIQGWVTALDRDDIDAAAGYFAIPSVAENGVLLHIRSPAQARLFNSSLPCGAHVVKAVSAGRFTTATFRLDERPGPGSCGAGAGGIARTAFVIVDGKIAQWRRVGAGGAGPRAPAPAV
jgi:limonene-1,2-epoxide hydrolase